jgi:hypothetical protein
MISLLTSFLPKAFSTIDKLVLDKDKAAEIKGELQAQILTLSSKELDAAVNVIQADAKGASWMQRNWRPSFMFAFLAIIVNNYLLYPYAGLFTDKVVLIEVSPTMWTFFTAVGGLYTIGRSGEKIMGKWKA